VLPGEIWDDHDLVQQRGAIAGYVYTSFLLEFLSVTDEGFRPGAVTLNVANSSAESLTNS
jgi:hypothetical protein